MELVTVESAEQHVENLLGSVVTIATDTSSMDWGKYFYYDETSPTALRWNITPINVDGKETMIQKGDIAGIKTGQRSMVGLHHKLYLTHRVVWELLNGPLKVSDIIDHINNDCTDNRISNLRVVCHTLNKRNKVKYKVNTSGVTGVTKSIVKGRVYWVAFWRDSSGKELRKHFPSAKYGDKEAFNMACIHRKEMIELRNKEGAGYTKTHGI